MESSKISNFFSLAPIRSHKYLLIARDLSCYIYLPSFKKEYFGKTYSRRVKRQKSDVVFLHVDGSVVMIAIPVVGSRFILNANFAWAGGTKREIGSSK